MRLARSGGGGGGRGGKVVRKKFIKINQRKTKK